MPTPHTRLYHFCTGRPPWIVGAKELRPNRNQIGGFPSPDVLRATTRSQGDRTAPGMQGYPTEYIAETVSLADWPGTTMAPCAS
ncbi:hypothetical protein SAMN05443247_05414 [Bradyrhizobium erythrophlei]|nr:hypothetical protein SAMN05443247_05414 [Bradyrhizobium erythrophlei]